MTLLFGDFVLDRRERALWRGPKKVALRPRAFGVLTTLAERAGQLVEKQQFFEALWGDVTVSDEVLKVAIREVRAALDDDARSPRYIETVAKAGYRFVAPVRAKPTTPRVEPSVRYVRRDGVSIAYQTWGTGPIDIVYVPGWVSHLEIQWAHPLPAAFLERLGRSARVLSFDKRGTGLSDRMEGSPPLEERMQDVLAVMAAEGSGEAVLFGTSEGAPMCALFAARHPELTRGLVLYGGSARPVNGPGFTSGVERALIDGAARVIVEQWGEPLFLEAEAPGYAEDPILRAWWARLLRSSASPSTAAALLLANADIDVSDTLPSIRVPTLVLHRKGDLMMPLAGGRFLAERIPNAKLVELEGDAHLPFIGPNEDLFTAFEAFLDLPSSAG
ncbi:MAG: alpha/beta fold hydrolase [Labilithrix sp.]